MPDWLIFVVVLFIVFVVYKRNPGLFGQVKAAVASTVATVKAEVTPAPAPTVLVSAEPLPGLSNHPVLSLLLQEALAKYGSSPLSRTAIIEEAKSLAKALDQKVTP